jgi:hypothetical protein
MRRSIVIALVGGLTIALTAAGTTSGAGSQSTQAALAPTTSGLVLNYGFNADTGVTARDSSSSAIHGTYVNTTAAAARSTGYPGRGYAIRLVGSSHQYVAVPERNAIDVDRYTLAALVRYTGVQNDQTLGRWEVLEKPAAYWINVRTDGKVRVGGFFGTCSSSGWKYLDSAAPIPKNTWTHVASTYNGSTLSVWINGKRVASRAVTGRTCSNDHPLAIGAKNYPAEGLLEAFWDGRLDDVRIYNRALSATEIAGLLPTGLVAA